MYIVVIINNNVHLFYDYAMVLISVDWWDQNSYVYCNKCIFVVTISNNVHLFYNYAVVLICVTQNMVKMSQNWVNIQQCRVFIIY